MSAVWSLAWFVVMQRQGGASWHFFLDGATSLSHLHDPVRGGLHLYAGSPVTQIGPVALLGVLVLLPAGGGPALIGWEVLGTAIGVFLLWYVRRLALRERPDLDRAAVNLWVAVAAFFFMPVWIWLAVGDAHVDDVLALAFAAVALGTARSGRPWLTGALLGLAVDAKPWALAFASLLLVLGDRRAIVRAALMLVGVVAVAWLPFFLADSGTASAMHYTIPNTPLSGLRVLGVHDARTPPWDRPVQTVLALALGVLAIWRGRWAAVLLLAMAVRVAIDPGTFLYYIAGPMLGAVIWDLLGQRRRLPWWSIGTCLILFGTRWIPMPAAVHGSITVAFLVACCALVLLPPRTRLAADPAVPSATPPSPAAAWPQDGPAAVPVRHDVPLPADTTVRARSTPRAPG